jgi:hypothetical protein
VILSPEKWSGILPVIWCAAFSGLCPSEAKESSRIPEAMRSSISAAEDEDEMSEREDRAKMIRTVIEAANVPIEFWGKVTDQDGVPLEGVKVAYTCLILWGNDVGVSWQPKVRKGQAVSDSTGSFAITGLRGNSLGLDSLSKPGYVYRGRPNHSFDFGGNMPEHKFVPLRDKPVCFAMVNERVLEPLVEFEGRLRVSGDGTPGYWNLWSGEPDDEDGPDLSGELSIIFRSELAVPANPAQLVNWSADLEIVRGGIMEAPREEEIHRAPESGYSATVPYSKEPEKQGIIGCAYYLRTRNGNYGRIQVEISPSRDGRTARCFITSEMNPRPGSRNLEAVKD